MKTKLAKLTSNVLNPFVVSAIVLVLLSFTFAASASEAVKWSLISIALSVVPVFAVVLYLVYKHKLDGLFINPRQQRNKIYLLAIAIAILSYVVLDLMGAPPILTAVFAAGLIETFIFMGINLLWKISIHTAFITGSVTILTIIFGAAGAWSAVLIPPVAWSRIEMKFHSPAQIVGGALISAAVVTVVFQVLGPFSASV
jgi:hypothetical protein